MRVELDPELVTRINAGDTQAFNELWARYGEALRRRARNRLWMAGYSLAAESMDVCQSVLFQVLKRVGTGELPPINDLGAYLAIAVKHKVDQLLEKCLSDKRDARRTEQNAVEEVAEMYDDASAPSHRALVNDLRQMVRNQLPERDRRAYDLHYEQGLTWPEVAEQLGEEPDTLRMRLERALKRIGAKYLQE
jgi:RNA polymerase sigma-70 factor (ECF subfamily)